MSTIHSPFPGQLITSNFFSVMIVFHRFFTRIVLGDVDLPFSLILVTKANAVEGGTISATWLYHEHNKSIPVTDGMAVMSLSGSLQHKTGASMDCLCRRALNQKLLHNFEKWSKFLSCVKVKLRKRKSCKMRLACTRNMSCHKF